jgi:regulator of protease activity HflC (stomatin/prohibitin superfamily)
MAIEFVFNALTILAFVAMFAGIALIVLGVSRGQGTRLGIILAVLGLILGIGFMIAAQGLIVVGSTETAVVFNILSSDTDKLEDPLPAGFHIVIPGIEQTFIYSTASQETTMSGDNSVDARSADGQNVFVDVTILFNIDPVNVNIVHTKWSTLSQGYVEGVITPVLRSEVREVIATVSAEELFGSSELIEDSAALEESSLERVEREIEERVTAELQIEGFQVSNVLIRGINFSDEFVNAIESRQVAELERDRASVEAETAQIEAEGRANARIEEARGEAEATLLEAAAEAEALRLVSEQIALNPNLIQYTYINELGDNVSLVIIPSNSPFLFDPNSFTELGADFTAPENETPTPPAEGSGN